MDQKIKSRKKIKRTSTFLTISLFILSSLMIFPALSINGSGAETEAQEPSYSIGDWWKYEFNETATFGLYGNVTMKVVGESLVAVSNTEYECYELEIKGEGQATEPFPYLPADWTMSEKEFVQKSDLAPVKIDLAIEWDITLDSFTKMKIIENSTYSPPFDNSDFPLTVGKIWSTVTNVNITFKVILDSTEISNVTDISEMNYNFEVLSMEMITVAGRTFDTFVIRETGEDGYTDYYYSSEARNYVKVLYYDVEENLVGSRELIDYTLHSEVPFDYTQTIILTAVIIVIVLVGVIFLMRKKKSTPSTVAPTTISTRSTRVIHHRNHTKDYKF